MIQLKRVYDPPSRADGTRFLIERLWPRGSELGYNYRLSNVLAGIGRGAT